MRRMRPCLIQANVSRAVGWGRIVRQSDGLGCFCNGGVGLLCIGHGRREVLYNDLPTLYRNWPKRQMAQHSNKAKGPMQAPALLRLDMCLKLMRAWWRSRYQSRAAARVLFRSSRNQPCGSYRASHWCGISASTLRCSSDDPSSHDCDG